MALLIADSVLEAENKCEEALNIAYALNDSNVLSDVYQDIATYNGGEDTLKILRTYTSCHCTKVIYLSNNVPPKNFGQISIRYKPRNSGKIKEEIIICIKGRKKPQYLKLKGVVL